MLDHLLILTAVMLVSGTLGGLVNYYQMLFTEEDPAGLARCLIMGLCGALMVPVLLKFTRSDLLLEIQGDPSRLLLFTGYCLLAAIASRVFVFHAARRQLRDASIARARVENLERELRTLQLEIVPLLEHEIEGDPDSGPALDFNQIRKLDDNALHVLRLLNGGDCVFRSLPGMVREGGMETNSGARALNSLLVLEMVGKIHSHLGIRWYITDKGRQVLYRRSAQPVANRVSN
ncbi:YEATS-associated helix-containing protein [Microbulbifer sp. 2201CG32-9]|uniref:YEATS-associated helix-containing protein n=1 Tax=Microbulbifer sp. 2201CG32-9 TaxID=3232309 RepID=UPI00345BF5A7